MAALLEMALKRGNVVARVEDAGRRGERADSNHLEEVVRVALSVESHGSPRLQ